MTFQRMFALFIALALAACGGGPGDTSLAGSSTPRGTMHLAGEVKRQSSSIDTPFALDGAGVRATIDRNHDGSISADEAYTTQTDANGAYALDVPVAPGDTLVVSFTTDGAAPVVRTLRAGPKGSMILNATLRDLEELQCNGTSCSLQRGGATLKGLPSGTTGGARVFNPVTETDAFPGNFDDSSGNLLVSGVFATFDLADESGNAVHELASPAEMRLLVPRDTWGVVSDIAPGNDRIDVPLYWFDDVKGTWVRDDNPGHLEDGQGNVIAPSSLPAIHDGTFAGAIYAIGNVTHFSTWNIDWPVESFGCVSGRVLDEIGKPAEGATVTLRGISYTGTSTPVVLGPDAQFCLEAKRSEAPGEDLDGNGNAGETTTVSIGVVAGENYYDLGEFEMPSSQGRCGGSGCLNLGDLRIGPANLSKVAWCTIEGTVRFPDGTPIEAGVILNDDSVRHDIADSMCATSVPDATCGADFTENGAFSVTSPVLAAPRLWSFAFRDLEPGVHELGFGSRSFTSCPTRPLSLTLDPAQIEVDFTIAVDGDSISWTPPGYGILVLEVLSAEGEFKWAIVSNDDTVMRAPITYGVVPVGASQVYPIAGTPAALAPGDQVEILTRGTTLDGVPYFGGGRTNL